MPCAIPPVRTIAPAEEPLTLDEAKDHVYAGDDDDAYITALITAATAALDGWSGTLGRCLVTQTWRQDYAAFPGGRELVLPFPDVQSVVVAYSDTDDANQTLAAATYRLLPTAMGASIFLKTDESWPETYDREDAVRITLVCGFGAAAAVPAALKQAMLMRIATWYANRESVTSGTVANLPSPAGCDALEAPYRWVSL